jgi:hypothetical protein
MSNNQLFKNILLSLGISPDLLNFDLEEQTFEFLYRCLCKATRAMSTPLKITASWQLLLLTGKVDILSCLLNNFSLSSIDNLGANPAYYAAWSGNFDNLNWVKTNAPDLFESKTNNGATIIDYAARSSNAKQFNHAIALSPTHDSLIIFDLKTNKETIDIIGEALNSNFTLLTVDIRCSMPVAVTDQICLKIQRNRAIHDAMPRLKQIIIGYYQQSNDDLIMPSHDLPWKLFPKAVLFNVF